MISVIQYTLQFHYFFHHSRCWDEKIMYSSKLSKYDEYLFSFWSIYILSIFVCIAIQKIMIIEKDKLKLWIKFTKFCIFWILFWLIKTDYALIFIFKLGVPNWLLIMNIIWNIISKKTVTEIWITFSLKLLINSMIPTILIDNYHWQWSWIKDFIGHLF